jgi:hypothetical protein
MTEEKNTSGGSEQEIQKASEINRVLTERIESLNKSFKVGLGVGIALCLIIITYLGVLYSGFAEVVEAETLADFVSSEASRRIPEVGRDVENQLKMEAPNIVNSFKNALLGEAVPAIGGMMEEKVYGVYKEFFTLAPKVLVDDIFVNVVKNNRGDLQKAVATEGALSDPEYLAAMQARLVKDMKARSERAGGDEISSELKQSVSALNDITARLKGLAGKRKLSEEEAVINRFISTWWTFLDSEKDEMTKGDVKIVTDNLKGSTKEIFQGVKDMAE